MQRSLCIFNSLYENTTFSMHILLYIWVNNDLYVYTITSMFPSIKIFLKWISELLTVSRMSSMVANGVTFLNFFSLGHSKLSWMSLIF